MDCTVIVTHPMAFLPLQLAEEKLQLFDCDAVAGEHTQHVHQQVCMFGMSGNPEMIQDKEAKEKKGAFRQLKAKK